MKHELKRIYSGKGITGKITPTCSCGWIGQGYEAHNDYQHSNVKEQEEQHFAKVRKDNQSPQVQNNERMDGQGYGASNI